MFCFTSNEIYKSVVQAAVSGTRIIVIADWNQAHHGYSKIPKLAYHKNISVYVVAKKTLHTKIMCIQYIDDSTCVLEGSYNYTASAKKHEETLDAHLCPSHYRKRQAMLAKIITKGIATPFSESALTASKVTRAHQKAMKKKSAQKSLDDDDDDDDITDSCADTASTPTTSPEELLSPPRKPKNTAPKPSPCSLDPGTKIDTSPITLARAATLLAQKQLESTLITHINEAKFICMIMYALSATSIADALIAAHEREAEVIIIADRLQSTGPSSQIERLREAGITVLRNTSDMLHCKCFIIETRSGEQLVIGGSANASSRVYAEHNIEHSTRLSGKDVFATYMKLYKEIAAGSEPLTAPIVLKTPQTAPAATPKTNAPAFVLADSTNKPKPRKMSKHSSLKTAATAAPTPEPVITSSKKARIKL